MLRIILSFNLLFYLLHSSTSKLSCSLFNFMLIEAQLIYNVALISGVQQSDAVTQICICSRLVASVMSNSLRPYELQPQAPLSMEFTQARILQWVAMPFFKGSSQSRDQTQVSCIAGGFFTNRATREAYLEIKIKSLKFFLFTALKVTVSHSIMLNPL